MRPLSTILLLVSSAGAFSPVTLPPPRQSTIPSCGATRSQCVTARRGPAPVGRPSDADSSIFRATGRLTMSASSALPATAASASPAARQFTQKKRICLLMSFMTGWADYLFITKYGYFATMHTGNLIKAVDAAMGGRTVDALFFLTAITSFMVGTAAFRSAELTFKEKALNGLLAPVVVGFMVWADYLMWANPLRRFLPAILLSFSWGIINAVGSQVTGVLVWVVTGAMIRFSAMMVDRIHPAAGLKKIPKEGLLMNLSVIGGFALGTAWSVFLSRAAPQLLSRGMFSIMGAIYGLLFLWVDRKELGAWWLKKGGKSCEIDEVGAKCE